MDGNWLEEWKEKMKKQRAEAQGKCQAFNLFAQSAYNLGYRGKVTW